MAAAQKEAYPEIVPQEFTESKENVFNRVLAAVDTLGWELVDQNLAEGRVEATDTTFWFRFKDDVIVLITETPNGTVLNARSKSRVGSSDIGKNAAAHCLQKSVSTPGHCHSITTFATGAVAPVVIETPDKPTP